MGSRFIQITGLSAGRWTCSLTPEQRPRDLSGHNSVLLQFKGVTIFFYSLRGNSEEGNIKKISEEDLYVKSHQDERWKRFGGRSVRILSTADLIGSDWLSDILCAIRPVTLQLWCDNSQIPAVTEKWWPGKERCSRPSGGDRTQLCMQQLSWAGW